MSWITYGKHIIFFMFINVVVIGHEMAFAGSLTSEAKVYYEEGIAKKIEVSKVDFEEAFNEFTNPEQAKAQINEAIRNEMQGSGNIYISFSRASSFNNIEGLLDCGITNKRNNSFESVGLMSMTSGKVFSSDKSFHVSYSISDMSKHLLQRKIALCLAGIKEIKGMPKLKILSPKVESFLISDSTYDEFEKFLVQRIGKREGDIDFYKKMLTCVLKRYYFETNRFGEEIVFDKKYDKNFKTVGYKLNLVARDFRPEKDVEFKTLDELFAGNKFKNVDICREEIQRNYCLSKEIKSNSILSVSKDFQDIEYFSDNKGPVQLSDGSFVLFSSLKKGYKYDKNGKKIKSFDVDAIHDSNFEIIDNKLVYLKGDFENPKIYIQDINDPKQAKIKVDTACTKIGKIQKISESSFVLICENGLVEKFSKTKASWSRIEKSNIGSIDVSQNGSFIENDLIVSNEKSEVVSLDTKTMKTVKCVGIVGQQGEIAKGSDGQLFVTTKDGNLFKPKIIEKCDVQNKNCKKICETGRPEKIAKNIEAGITKLPNGNFLITSREKLILLDPLGKDISPVSFEKSKEFIPPQYSNRPTILADGKSIGVLDSRGVVTVYDLAGNKLNNLNVAKNKIFREDPVLLSNGKLLLKGTHGFSLLNGFDGQENTKEQNRIIGCAEKTIDPISSVASKSEKTNNASVVAK